MQTESRGQSGTSSSAPTGNPSKPASTTSTAPGQIRVIKRNGAVVGYDESKIVVAITKAYLAVEGGTAAASSRVHDSVTKLGKQISTIFLRRMPSGGTIHIEDVQDQVELALMRSGEHKVARSYVLYRAERARLRETQRVREQDNTPAITVTHDDGTQGPLDTQRLRTVIDEACEGLENVSADDIYNETI